ncbi:long-chain fatty acid--CoA ligase [Spongiactinospora gelatinilytica]|uniref:Long-chain fatty acid--CoA ligase n=1 Tax=Spongiactinospora gelatinilytica TaxID=2666298 RepID=A0A2W2IAL4_9ACTN|nr:class I adenylate-forming enzyme family protein [Spongiactinospora gelatinilytica]PZG47434.1 long-chain fatty acid--CoA ligase [Spongiactinospora gelatinilytica]
MTLSEKALLNMEQRHRFAARSDVGGGNLLASAIEFNPHPEARFIRSARPITMPDGSEQTDFNLLELDELAQSWAVWYLGKGVKPRDRVAVYMRDSFAYFVHYCALASIGAIALLVNSKSPQEIAVSLIRKTTPVGLYTDREHLARLGDELGDLSSVQWVQLSEELPAPPAAELPKEARWKHAPDDPVSIMHSSGTTGLPKPVTQTHRSSVAGPKFRLTTEDPTLVPGAVMLAAMPQSHLGNIHYSTYAIFAGTPIIPAFDPSPEELVEAIRTYRPTAVMGFGHTCSDLAGLDLEPGALDSVGHWVTTADAVHYEHIRKVLAQRAPGLPRAAWLDRLGTTELGWAVLLKVTTLASERNDRCVGKPVGVSEVAVLRKDGTPCEVGEIGLLGAAGPAITAGYWNDADTTYRSRLGGYWCPGDMVYRDADDNFYHVDRAVDTIETAEGPGYSVLMEETLLAEVPEIQDVAVVAARLGGETVAVAAATSEAGGADPQKILDAANAALKTAGHPAVTVLEIIDALPVGVTGKVLKRKLRERYAELDELVERTGPGRTAVAGRAVVTV